MVSNDLQWPRSSDWSEPGPGRLLHYYKLHYNPRPGREDSLLPLCMQITSWTRADIQALHAERQKVLSTVPVSIIVKSSGSRTRFRSWLICSPRPVHDDNVTWSCTHCDALVQTRQPSDNTHWHLMKLSPASGAAWPVFVVTCDHVLV